MSQARLTDNTNTVVFGLWWIHQPDGSDLPIPHMQSEIIRRKGLGNAVRRLGTFAPGKVQAMAKTDVVTRQDAEALHAALLAAEAAYIPLQLEIKRADGTWFDYDSVDCRFLILSEIDSPGIVVNTRRVLRVYGGYFSTSQHIVDLSFTFLPVLI
jgi:hypothetical protein